MDKQIIIERVNQFIARINPMISKLESLAAAIEQKEAERETFYSKTPDSAFSETCSGPLASILRELKKLNDEFKAVQADIWGEANEINPVILELVTLVNTPSITYEDNYMEIPLARCKKARNVIQALLAEMNSKE